jgi:AcrR family transcriptional regulator
MEVTAEQKETTREMIVRKAAELFNLHGYMGCSMSDIMEATQLKKGGIYNHFTSKDEIALEAFKYSYTKVIERFRSRLDRDTSPVEKLFSIIDVYASLIEEPVMKGGCPIFNTAVDASDNHSELKEMAKDGLIQLQRYIEIKVEEGIRSKMISSTCNPSEIASLIIINLEGAIIMNRINENNLHMQNAVRFLKRHISQYINN